jgi:serine/threonine protein kinase
MSIYEIAANVRLGMIEIPESASSALANLIQRLLRVDPSDRPTLEEITTDPFFDLAEAEGLADFREIPVQLKESESMVSVTVPVCGDDYCFDLHKPRAFSWPGNSDH